MLGGLFMGVYIFFFYYFYDGEDVGFDFIDYILVDECLGDWENVKKFGELVDIMVDFIVNYMLG